MPHGAGQGGEQSVPAELPSGAQTGVQAGATTEDRVQERAGVQHHHREAVQAGLQAAV